MVWYCTTLGKPERTSSAFFQYCDRGLSYPPPKTIIKTHPKTDSHNNLGGCRESRIQSVIPHSLDFTALSTRYISCVIIKIAGCAKIGSSKDFEKRNLF